VQKLPFVPHGTVENLVKSIGTSEHGDWTRC